MFKILFGLSIPFLTEEKIFLQIKKFTNFTVNTYADI